MPTDISQSAICWLHLSDFHVGMDNFAQRKLFGEIQQHVRQCQAQGCVPDLIFITGDVANRGKPEEYTTFASEFLAPLHALLGAEAKERTFIIPGNHDVSRDMNKYFSRDEIYEQNSRFFDPTPEGAAERKQMLPRFTSYSVNEALVPLDWLDTMQGCYVRILDIKGVKLGIVGINTAWLSKDNHDRHMLSPGINLLEDALKQCDNCDLKIVLGHHPVEWFRDEHVPPIRAILGRHHALYLHGHLHKNRVSPEDGAGNGYLCVQSGAAFQNRDGDYWVNGLLWAELDLPQRLLRLQPREWNPDNYDWPLAKDLPEIRKLPGSEWWGFPLPGGKLNQTMAASALTKQVIRYPTGWQLVDRNFLDRQREVLDSAHALRFFDGAIPDWRIALCPDIPRRAMVGRVVQQLTNYVRQDRPQVVLLIGPIGEGKSTALMQIVANVMESNTEWNVLWHTDESTGLNVEELFQLPRTHVPWLLASDAADLIANDLYQACQRLRQEQRSDIRFLLACRDTDWVAAKAHKSDWITRADFRQETISGLLLDEAIAIVGAWLTFGDEATCRFTVQDQETAARQLFEAASEEATRHGGALLGALLKVRYGDDLKEHVKALLNRLAERKIPGGGDLLLAFAYVAAMHAEGLHFLSRPVLAEALNCPLYKLNSLVLAPLGMEAATSNDGQFILTRHREIARIAVDLLQDVFSKDIEEIYLELVESAERLRAKGEFVIYLPRWYYDLPKHFFKKGRRDFAIKIGRTLLDQNPTHDPLRVHLSSLYREAGGARQAMGLFRNFEALPRNRRACMMEWGRSTGAARQWGSSSVLISFSLADEVSPEPPQNKSAKMAFDGLAEAFEMLYDQYHERTFNEGRATVARLGLTLPLEDKSRARFMKHLRESGEAAAERLDLDREISRLTNALRRVWELDCADAESLGPQIPAPASMTFQRLKRLLINAFPRTHGISDEESQRTH